MQDAFDMYQMCIQYHVPKIDQQEKDEADSARIHPCRLELSRLLKKLWQEEPQHVHAQQKCRRKLLQRLILKHNFEQK